MAELIGDANQTLSNFPHGKVIIEDQSSAEAEPAIIIPTGKEEQVRTYFNYSGSVTACDLRIWSYDDDEIWYEGPTCEDALTGTNEYRDWKVSPGTWVGFTVDSITGGSVSVRAEGVNRGTS